MRLVVTGAAGQIGSYVVDAARSAQTPVLGLDRRPSPWTDVAVDIRDLDALMRILQPGDRLVHCAAQVFVEASLLDPIADASHNVAGTLAVLEAARRKESGRVVHVSSAAVYGAPAYLPLDEDHPRKPLNPYGVSKLAAEHYAEAWARIHGLDVVIARPFNVYSARQAPGGPYAGVMTSFAERVRRGGVPTIRGTGEQTRDFVHARDVASALRTLTTIATGTTEPLAVNIGSGRETSIRDLAVAFLTAVRLPDDALEMQPARSAEVLRSVADTSRARKLGIVPTVPLEVGIRELLG